MYDSNKFRVIAGMPITALFVLFDLVVHNPRHPEIWSNLALLDVAGGHFSRIQYASGGTLPGSLITEFAYIAREYVNNVHRQGADDSNADQEALSSSLGSPVFPVVKLDHTPHSATLSMPLDGPGTTMKSLPVSGLSNIDSVTI